MGELTFSLHDVCVCFVGSKTKMSFCEKEGPGPTPCPLSYSESQIRAEGTQKGTKGWVSEMGAACQAWKSDVKRSECGRVNDGKRLRDMV